MALDIRLHLRQTQKLVMTAMLQQAIKLLPLSRMELVETVQQELLENPALEEVSSTPAQEEAAADDGAPPAEEQMEEVRGEAIDWGAIDWENLVHDRAEYMAKEGGEPERPSLEATLRSESTLSDHLLWQLSLSARNDRDKELGSLIIGNIEPDGYFRGSLEEIAQESGASLEEAEEALSLIQSFDPTGVAARDLKECLLLQVRGLGLGGTPAEKVVAHHLEELEERHFARLARTLGITLEDMLTIARLIRSLDPAPGSRYNPQRVEYITPDVFVHKVGDEYQVSLNEDGLPRLRVNPLYRRILRGSDHSMAKERKYLEERMRSALWFIKSIEQRRQTLLKVAKSIVKFQRDFLDGGVAHLKPLVLRDVAEDIEMHESTVSRVTTNKFIHTPQGIFELKFFFHSALDSAAGDTFSSVSVKDQIQKLVASEDARKPLTDQEIVEELKARDIIIARRTVTKYRKELRIPPANRRRRFYDL
ncbi:MAG: RNA polymerase factor sigma-54 [Nitrospinota bacterium]